MNIGNRVVHRDGGVGHIEAIDNDSECPIIDVRWLTPDNKPSVVTGMCRPKDLTCVPDHVLPMPRSDEWWEEARAFQMAIENALYEEGFI